MTLISSWLLGSLAIGSMLMCFLIWPVVHAELIDDGVPFWRNRAFWLSSALIVHPVGAMLMLAATILAGIEDKLGVIMYLLWGAWSLWLVSKTMVITALGRIRLILALYGVWTLVVIFWRLV